MGIMTSHLLPHTVVKRSIKLIYVKVLSKLNNAMQMGIIIVAFLARYLILHYLPGSVSLGKFLQGEKEQHGEQGLPAISGSR